VSTRRKSKGGSLVVSGQDHGHDGEGRIARLADQGEVAFVLLGVAEPARPDQHDRSLGCPDGLLQSLQPGQTRRKAAPIKE
jgi:hypothetical protein